MKQPSLTIVAGAVGIALWLPASQAMAQADDAFCKRPPVAFAEDVKLALSGAGKGNEQRVESNLLELLNTCGADAPPMRILFEQAGQVDNNQSVLAMASILGTTKSPWQAPDAATQEAWKARFYKAMKEARDPFTEFKFNAALMNANGLYRGALAQFPQATPDKDSFADVKKGLRNTLAFTDSPNYDDAKFLLAELGLRELIFKRLNAAPAQRSDAEIAGEAIKLLDELISQPGSKPAKYVLYAYWDQALMHTIMGDTPKAREQLEKMKRAYDDSLVENPALWNHTLYYYRPLAYPDFAPVNNHVTAIELYDRWKAASKKLEDARTSFDNAAGIKALAEEVRKAFTGTSTYFIPFATVRTRKEADEALADLRRKLPQDTVRGELAVYPPWPERRLYSVGTRLMTLPEARTFLEKQPLGVPKGTPITRFY